VRARDSASACRSCSRKRALSARVRSRSARPHIRPAVRATSTVSRSASADSPPDASVAIHVTAVTPPTIASAITATRRKRTRDRAGPNTSDACEPNSAVAMSQGDSLNSDSARSQRRRYSSKGSHFGLEGRFHSSAECLSTPGSTMLQPVGTVPWVQIHPPAALPEPNSAREEQARGTRGPCRPSP
jgi:hypothetical protein